MPSVLIYSRTAKGAAALVMVDYDVTNIAYIFYTALLIFYTDIIQRADYMTMYK